MWGCDERQERRVSSPGGHRVCETSRPCTTKSPRYSTTPKMPAKMAAMTFWKEWGLSPKGMQVYLKTPLWVKKSVRLLLSRSPVPRCGQDGSLHMSVTGSYCRKSPSEVKPTKSKREDFWQWLPVEEILTLPSWLHLSAVKKGSTSISLFLTLKKITTFFFYFSIYKRRVCNVKVPLHD